MQRGQRRPIARDQQTAAGVPVEPMDEFQRLARARCAQGFDDTEAHAAAAVHRDPARLVDDQQMPILKNDRAFDELEQALRRSSRLLARIDAHRRQAHLVAGGQTVFGVDALAIDAHLALAQQPVDAATRHGFEMSHQKIVDALSGLLVADFVQYDWTLRSMVWTTAAGA
jgi:hypothetical protein